MVTVAFFMNSVIHYLFIYLFLLESMEKYSISKAYIFSVLDILDITLKSASIIRYHIM